MNFYHFFGSYLQNKKKNYFFFDIFLVFVSPNAIKHKQNENNLIVALYCIFSIFNKAQLYKFRDMIIIYM